MSEFGEQLAFHRGKLNDYLFGTDYVQVSWTTVEPLLDNWWMAYKFWECGDSFNKAFRHKRMTVRTFPGTLGVPKDEKTPHPEIQDDWGEKGFTKQGSKVFKHGTINVVDTQRNKDTKQLETEIRIFADSNYTPLGSDEEEKRHDKIFHKTDEHYKYGAQRGINSSAFEDPSNFATRETKYEQGLHDLSASLLNPDLSIFSQVHNNDWDAHFSFLPLSKEEDQLMLFNLTRIAKALRSTLPALYEKVRYYRADMTRVKLANEFDMGIGYTAIPVANPGGGPAYKLRYGLTKNTTIIGPNGQQSVKVTAELYRARQLAALKFKSILGIRDAKNEIVIAIRRHMGAFPVYAVRQGGQLKCYDIVDNKMKFNGKTISSAGVMSG